ncbi:type IVB secretion system protein IcmJDotN [Castellaniella sp.]|uniref:type IVB secretion system protein IcmJDotN n=1 Tax=Castellaniella sp. TaxID=1955812 RepID=UPI002AFDEBC5|nr:type IVB secretion system protein IcmJDotN [Castellaniella sp.]
MSTQASLLPSIELPRAPRTEMQPIIGVKRGVWRRDDEHAALADEAFAPKRKSVFERDGYACRYCGFKASKYQEVHHMDDNHANNDVENLLTVCTLCHQVHHLGMFAMRNAGFLAVLPEFTQAEVNHLCRIIHVTSIFAEQSVGERLQGLFTLFMSRGMDTLKRPFGCDLSDPYLLTQILSGGDDKLYGTRNQALADLRLVSTKNAFHAGQLEFYAQHCRDQFLPGRWSGLARQMCEVR